MMAECSGLLDLDCITQLPALEELALVGLSLALEGSAPGFTALTSLLVREAGSVCVAASLPRLQRLELGSNQGARLAGAGLQLPALSSLALSCPPSSNVAVDLMCCRRLGIWSGICLSLPLLGPAPSPAFRGSPTWPSALRRRPSL